MNKEEFLIYCLLYAVDAAGVKKQNLVHMALKTDSVDFVRIYNVIQQHDEATRKSIITSCLKDFNKEEMIEEIKNTILADFEIDMQAAILETLN